MKQLSDADRMTAFTDETNALVAENRRLVTEAHNIIQVQRRLVAETRGLFKKLRQEVQVSRALTSVDMPPRERRKRE